MHKYSMLSQAQPIIELFETASTEPINYLQALQKLLEPVVPPEVDPNKMMTLQMDRINRSSIGRYKSAFYSFAEKVRNKEMSVSFDGLGYFKEKFTKDKCCSWFSQHNSHPERELIQLLSAIESQSLRTRNHYHIKMVD
jgi:hypothetical protein